MENIFVKEYSERSFVVTGDTKPIKEQLKKLGGLWFKKEGGWLFSNKRRADVDAYLKRYGVDKLHTWTYWADR